MNLKDCFNAFEGDYNGAMNRLLTEERVKKFLLMFLKDTSFSELDTAMKNNDYETAFRAAHTLKGTCSNLAIAKLEKSASNMTEALRVGDTAAAVELLPQVASDYELTVTAINNLD